MEPPDCLKLNLIISTQAFIFFLIFILSGFFLDLGFKAIIYSGNFSSVNRKLTDFFNDIRWQ